jgi:2-dehydropantoate 2-reductase
VKALIYGGGAVGLGITSCLLKAGVEVDVIAREETVSALRREGLSRTGIFGDYHIGPENFGSSSSLNELSPSAHEYDYILVCTKSHDSSKAAEDISSHSFLLGEKGKIVLFQNGWGNADIFCSFFAQDQIYNARVITGFQRPRKNVVEITVHADAIHIGSLFGGALSIMEPLCHAISKGGIPCQVVDEVGKDLWAKMLYNCALNPLGAVFGVPYGALGEQPYSREIMNRIIKEVFRVMEASGYQTHWPTAEDYITAFYEKLLPPTAGHESSTLQDLRAKKSTEIDSLSGAVVRLGEKAEIKTPYNSMLYNMVKFMENF